MTSFDLAHCSVFQFRETFVEVFCKCCGEDRPGWLRLSTMEQKNVNVNSRSGPFNRKFPGFSGNFL
jgi:hypothetical protein